ncbi:vigilin-like [Penaeus monodon]|uniref:vigilin-like n=1 Tax=Penaeus monodon TaxID=6687 RepID=UPI0018A70C0C|nr:vigilin-like [Penaeus monodon]
MAIPKEKNIVARSSAFRSKIAMLCRCSLRYNVRVTVPKDESPISISGKSESVHDAIKELEELVQQDVPKQHVFLPVNILPEDLGVAIGKGGSQSSKVKEEFGVKLYTRCNKHPQRPLVVVGPLEEAQKAVAYIEQHVAERRRLNEERAEKQCRREEVMGTFPVNVESNQIGRVIGKGGFRISYIAKRYSVKIQLPERNKEDGAVLVMGLKEDAQAAAAVLELVANRKLLPKHILAPLRISHEDNLIVLGPKGCRAAGIEREFGVRLVGPVISMPLMVEGGVEAVTSAVAFVEEMYKLQRNCIGFVAQNIIQTMI